MCTTVMIVYVFFVYYKNTHTQIITVVCNRYLPTYYAKQRSLSLAILSQPHARTDVQQFYDYVCIFVFIIFH